jgi:hypothetical protein
MQLLRTLNLSVEAHLAEFLEWHRRIVTWGLGVYVGSYVADIENSIGAPGRGSLMKLVMTEKEVTATVNLGVFDEQAETEQAETEQDEAEREGIEQADAEKAETEQADIGQAGINQVRTEEVGKCLPSRRLHL